MRILWVSEFPPDKGAVSDYSGHLLDAMTAQKEDLEVDVLSISGEEPEELDESIEVTGKIPEDSSEWEEIFSGQDYDLVHFQYYLPHLRQFIKYKLLGGKSPELMITLHDVPSDLKHKLLLLVFRKVILLTDETEQRFRDAHPVLPRLLGTEVYQAPYLGIDKNLPERVESKDIEKELDTDAINIVCPGFIHRKKGFHKVVEVLPELREELGNVKLTLAGGLHREGDEEYLEQIKQTAEELEVSEHMRITGLLPTEDHVNAYIKEADVVALPFDDISQSATLTKTLALGSVPVVTPVETLEPVIEKYGGIMIEKDSADRLKKGLKRAIQNRPKVKSEKIRENLSWEGNAERYLEIYSKSKS